MLMNPKQEWVDGKWVHEITSETGHLSVLSCSTRQGSVLKGLGIVVWPAIFLIEFIPLY